MGPEATAELYLRIVRLFQSERGAVLDSDFPEMVILNLPIPDVVADADGVEQVREMLIAGARTLEAAGADFIAIPCNTVAYHWEALQEALSIPVLNILMETASAVRAEGLKRIGLLGTESTIRNAVYPKAMGNEVGVLVPDEEGRKETTRVIMSVLSGRKSQEDGMVIERLARELLARGAEKVVLGCTELPLVVRGPRFIDTIDVLARAAYREAICPR